MKKVLVIENEASAKTETVKHLIEEGYNVFNAESVTEGISNAIIHLPDFIISDIHMPQMSGYSVAGELWNPFQVFLSKDCYN